VADLGLDPVKLRRLLAVTALLPSVACAGSRVVGALPGAEPPGIVSLLVLDRATGTPIAGARVALWGEDIRPTTLSAPLIRQAVSDEFGIASLRETEDEAHWVVTAVGYAPWHEYGRRPARVVSLVRGLRVEGTILDPLGRPATERDVRWIAGCPHGPILSRGRTDRNGRISWDHVDPHPEFPSWLVIEGLSGWSSSYGPEYFLQLGDRTTEFVAQPSMKVTGVVYDDEQVVAGCIVRGAEWQRFAISDSEGRFVLDGLAAGEAVTVFRPAGFADATAPLATVERFDPRVPVRIGRRPGESARLDLSVVDSGGVPVAGHPVVLVSAEDGAVHTVTTDDGGRASARVPGGKYLVKSESRLLPVRIRDGLAISVPSAATVVADAQPRLLLDITGLPETYRSYLVLVGEQRLVTDGPIHLPDDEPAALRIEADGIERVFLVGPADAEGQRRVSGMWPPLGEIVLNLPIGTTDVYVRSIDGVPLRWWREAGRVVVGTHATGVLSLEVLCALGTEELQRMPVRASVGDHIDLAAWRPPTIRVALADGSPAAGAVVFVDGREVGSTDESGIVEDARLKEGAIVRVSRAGFAGLSRRLEGVGPYALRWGDASMEVRTAGRAIVCVGGNLWESDGSLRIQGLDPGECEVLAGAPGKTTHLARASLVSGQVTRVDIGE